MRLLISGYYGFGNIGDEAILAAILEQLPIRAPEAEIVVLSGNPRRTQAEHDVQAVSRRSPATVWRELRRADLLISGGGGLIQDTTSALSPLYYLGVLNLARLVHTPYMIFAQGLGPLRRRLSQRLTAWACGQAAAVTVRDEPSAAMLRNELALPAVPVHVTADPALLLSPCDSERTEQLLRNCGISAGQPAVGVSLRPWPQGRFVAAMPPLVRHLRESLGVQVLLIPFQSPEDLDLARRLAADCGGQTAVLDGVTDPREFLGVISSLDLLVSMRLHALILAAAGAVPALALSYDPKVQHFAQTANQPAINLAEVSAALLIERVNDLWTTREQKSDKRRQVAIKLRNAAQRNFEVLAELIEDVVSAARQAE